MNALEIKNLSKTYPGFQLDHIDLVLPSGCIMGLIGENGAGKSTTIKLILDAVSRNSGSVSILGKDNKIQMADIKEEVGIVLDEVGFPECLTAKQVGKIMLHTYRRWDMPLYRNYLRTFSLPEDKMFKEFSRGMKMKLGIAVALSHRPKLLILDEATSGLDPVIRDEVLDIFHEFTRAADHAVLISSHIVSDLEKLCDYIAFLHKGKILLCEEKDQLMEEYGIIHCTKERLSAFPSNAVIGKKETPYGVDAIVKRSQVPPGLAVSPVSIEDLFVFMVKGER